MYVRKPEQSIRRVSEQGELADGYSKAQKSRTKHSVPNAVEHCGVTLLYGIGKPSMPLLPYLQNMDIYIVYMCIFL